LIGGPADSNALTAWDYKIDKSIIVYLEPYREDTLQFLVHWWSPNGKYFIGGKQFIPVMEKNFSKLNLKKEYL
jgi:hypothetical protein